ncbi:hypothetical protein OG730_18870 [Streptomyces sp. NBC_01298]|nr:hypothetical protein OG730_18870 [Streptomyces sp. NBC_01298]
MTDDNEDQAHAQSSRRSALAVTLGAVVWVGVVVCIVAKGWGA